MGKKRHRQIRKKGLPPGTLIYTGSRPQGQAIVKTVRFSADRLDEQDGFAPDFARNKNGTVWVDVLGLTDVPLIEHIGTAFQIHPLALEDVLDTSHHAKLEEYDNGLFFIVTNLRLDATELELHTEQISIFCGADFVVSFQEDADDTLLPVCNRLREARGRIRKKGPDYLAYSLVDAIVDNYYTILDELEAGILALEQVIHAQNVAPETKLRIFGLKRVIGQFRRQLVPLRDAAMRFYRTDSPVVDESNRVFFRDVSDHVLQMLDSVDNLRDQVSGIQELYQAELGNRMNNVMRLLTVISTIFIPLSFITGMYGMNFDYIPGLHNPIGFFVLSFVMFGVMAGMLVYFRVKKWI